MSFPLPPGPRMAYDRDGTIVTHYTLSDSTPDELSSVVLQGLNSERYVVNALGGNDVLNFVFPEKRRVLGLFVHGMWSIANYGMTTNDWISAHCHGSPDTTNGIDGTWTEVGWFRPWSQVPFLSQYMRVVSPWHLGVADPGLALPGIVPVSSLAATQLRGFRMVFGRKDGTSEGLAMGGTSPSLHTVHLYGAREVTATQDGLQFWGPVNDEPLGIVRWGDAAIGSSADMSFRVKNMSVARTAQQVTLSTSVLSDATPPIGPSLLYSLDGVSWSTWLSIGNLSPGAVSAVVRIRRVTPASAQMGPWSPRMVADVGAWV